MTASELALVVAAVLSVLGFVALALVLYRVLLALREVQGSLLQLRTDTAMMVGELRAALDEARDTVEDARSTVDEARDDLERFDRVLGSAEAISANVEGASRVARLALSAPVIKTAAIATGTRRTFGRLRRRTPTTREITR
jgi:hypothetical protein